MLHRIRLSLHALFPGHCYLCEADVAPAKLLCEGCQLDLPWLGKVCQCCSIPMMLSKAALCGHCLAQPPAYDRVYGLFAYAPPVNGLIKAFKFNQRLFLSRLFSQLMVEYMQHQMAELPDLVIPVPLHRTRIRERGFNQALELAKPICKKLDLSLTTRLVSRSVYRCPQSGLPAKQRISNIAGAFSVNSDVLPDHVLLVDDVMTTGATLNALATVLKSGGVRRVDALVLARSTGREK